MAENNAVLVGREPAMNYVLACITLFHGGTNEVVVKTRGRTISRAINVAEVIRRRFLTDLEVKDTKIGTEQITSAESVIPTNVSTIEVMLSK